ncbi:hypothetical protein CGRA01v4_14714 [Colletotrichum graminicola]|nr:hypothetical protein CGRA01v4_14714 [Colletotrichum graminicola]
MLIPSGRAWPTENSKHETACIVRYKRPFRFMLCITRVGVRLSIGCDG